jgi:hypothetical protein
VVVPRIGMLIVKVAVQIPERTMKSAVLATAVEAVLVRALVDFRRAIVEAVMSVMIAGVVIIVVARRRWRPWQREPQDAGQRLGAQSLGPANRSGATCAQAVGQFA